MRFGESVRPHGDAVVSCPVLSRTVECRGISWECIALPEATRNATAASHRSHRSGLLLSRAADSRRHWLLAFLLRIAFPGDLTSANARNSRCFRSGVYCDGGSALCVRVELLHSTNGYLVNRENTLYHIVYTVSVRRALLHYSTTQFLHLSSASSLLRDFLWLQLSLRNRINIDAGEFIVFIIFTKDTETAIVFKEQVFWLVKTYIHANWILTY